MLRGVFCGFLFFCLTFVEVKSQDVLPALLTTYQTKNPKAIEARLSTFISSLREKQSNRSEEEFLRIVFNESHRKFFKTYKPYTQFPEVFEKGRYDCLSATSLLAVILEEFGYNFHLIETNYHIFISVQTETGPVLLESTDRVNGFVTNPEQIQERISTYKQNQLQASNSGSIHYQFDLNLYNVIQPGQLSGLLLFNQAVVAFNNQQYEVCALRLKEAVQIYDSPRTTEFAAILITAIANSSISDETKKDLIRPFAKYIRGNATVALR
ncbi:MAG: hypothetical protein E6Q96_08290 [Cyclobacteriaceae bacterium]|nr:MAG: hypothetical protein E6Q96_08290 [Cyclobacteriaceae bacterium]